MPRKANNMPRLALALCLFWFVSLFLFRSIVQFRKTGSTGIKGFHGRVGSLPWVAGVAASLGLILAPLGPIASILGWPGGTLVYSSTGPFAFGVVCVLAGILGALYAQLSMGASWRVGVDESERTALVMSGLFSWVRNPIFSFIGLSVFGLVLLVPNGFTLLAAVLTLLGIELQVRGVEEPYLLAMHGDAYREYTMHVGRFIPRMAHFDR